MIEQKEWFDIKEIATSLQISPRAAAMLIKKYSSQLLQYLKNERSPGRTGKKTFINKEGLTILANIRNDTGKRKVTFHLAKTQFTENAITTADNLQALLQDPIIALRVDQLQTKQKLDELNNKVSQLYIDREQAHRQLIALPESQEKPKELTLRAMLRERINTYAGARGISYADCWTALYKQIYYRYQFNANVIAKHRDISMLDALEQEGLLKDAFNLACELFKI